ncbi:MAG: hypothetical protein H0V89_03150, partial [Deltaproteobacteria bacterium]|nr:hypothetical protein [Deltaproteobacteria bacterium]
MKRAAGSILAAALLLVVAIGLGWRKAAEPPVPSPLDSWKGPSPDPLENKLRKLTFPDRSTARLRVPPRWNQRRAEALVVLLPRAGESAAAAAGRNPGLLAGPWLVLVPEHPADAAGVQAGIDRVRTEYRT